MIDTIVVGAGVIGLAIAREAAQRGDAVMVLERAGAIGQGISSRNSEVIHAGLHGPAASLKVRTAIAGREALYRYCHDKNIPHRCTGKLIVACEEGERSQLHGLASRALANGVAAVELIGARDVQRQEPQLRCLEALWVPQTGIVDSHALLFALLADLESCGGELVTRTRVAGLSRGVRHWRVRLYDSGYELRARRVVNAAGLGAWGVAKLIAELSPSHIPPRFLAKGHYFHVRGKPLKSHLVYPLPRDGGLGIHATLDLAGNVRFGPDVTWVDAIDYGFPPGDALQESFARAIARYLPAINAGHLSPAYTGIRPRLTGPGAAPADFMIQTARDHGLAGLTQLFGIESPGLTASLELARMVVDRMAGQPADG